MRRRKRVTCDMLFATRRGGLYACTRDKGHDGDHRQGNAKPYRGDLAIVIVEGGLPIHVVSVRKGKVS